eukprot:7410350-Pyramimonas_sp.AAC.1
MEVWLQTDVPEAFETVTWHPTPPNISLLCPSFAPPPSFQEEREADCPERTPQVSSVIFRS